MTRLEEFPLSKHSAFFVHFRIVTDRSVLYVCRTMNRNEARKIRRRAILDAAADQFAGRRFDEVKLDEVAARAGVGKGTLYLYFKSKEDLFVALAIDGSAEMAARIREIADSARNYREKLFLFGTEFSFFLQQRHGLMRLIRTASSEGIEKRTRPHHEKVIKAVYYLIEAGVKEGIVREDISVETLHCMLMGPLFIRIPEMERVGKNIDLDTLLQGFWDAAKVKDRSMECP